MLVASSLCLLAMLAATTGPLEPNSRRLADLQLKAAAADVRPNILLIMADDLDAADQDSERLKIMPNTKSLLVDHGASFINHVAASPVCGPSRSSFLLARYPHNAGIKANGDGPSLNDFLSKANNSLGKWLSDAGYYTSFHGKYVNGAEDQVPSGWTHWNGFTHGRTTTSVQLV